MSDSDESVFSPPERFEICFQDFLLGRTENRIPSLNGSSESKSSNSASPPLVMSYIKKNLPDTSLLA